MRRPSLRAQQVQLQMCQQHVCHICLVENFHHDQVMTSETLGPPIKLACIVVGLGQADLVEQNRALQAMGPMGPMGPISVMALRGCHFQSSPPGSGCIPGAKEPT